ncbi:2-oxoglutarate oxidoreductase [Candidatus Bipolaricaulota bacterium]|nr:2-oxoglutarate oxidoreductase [Candidatus Bipolaricaulota bacterium]MBS3814085.1 2-oxoglutarate oxidoreductase [Candidatus Bipolaricaulota bacterium]MBS3825442.1 2-oxoglutarate oxidoreductase [Candidatus Bipolaricaulota bacterium]
MEKVFDRPKSLNNQQFSYCPGCHHGVINRLIAETIDELGIQDNTVGTAPVGCSVFLYKWFDIDVIQPAHGRVSAVATGVKRARPDLNVFAYQGDGDFASIGTNNSTHAANRGDNITVFFINNTLYGMTGGEMSPTTLLNQKTTTTPKGRKAKDFGPPIKMSEMLSALDGPTYITRQAVYDVKRIDQTKKAIKKAFRIQTEGKGYALVEILSACPINWGMDPVKANERIKEEVENVYPLGDILDRS